ncbi:hypothetical protein BKI52_26830 [marine bacterium AO1-C]|nr:hypothetical protein BKI52_26830 [marine bacterium AO1-C]
MSPTFVYNKLEELIRYFTQELENYTEEQFQYKNDSDTWSLAQMYQHMYTASTFFMYSAGNCLQQRKGSTEGEKTSTGIGLYQRNAFPDQEIKQPKEWTKGAPEAKAKEEAKNQWQELLPKLKELAEKVAQDDGGYKNKHVIFGMLTAAEWYQQIEMHNRHHLKQKKKLENFANVQGQEFQYQEPYP